MIEQKLILSHLYPQLMNSYADRGNLLIIRRRLQAVGYKVEIQAVHAISALDLTAADFLFMGGGSGNAPRQMVADLQSRSLEIKDAVSAGLPALFISEAYLALGSSHVEPETLLLKWFSFHVRRLPQRQVGNMILQTLAPLPPGIIAGFINRTYELENYDTDLRTLGRVEKADSGVNGQSEGHWYKRWIGTQLHGPVLAKSMALNEYICQNILDYRNLGKLPSAYDYQWAAYAQAQAVAGVKA